MSRSTCIILFWLAPCSFAMAWQEPIPPPEKKESPAASYLNVSFEAVEALGRAAKSAEAGQWALAATTFQQIGEKFGMFLIAADTRRYISVREFVNLQVSRWPDEGLRAYQAEFEIPARAALKTALEEDGVEALVLVADRFFATHAGATALDEAGERAIERGDFKSAKRWYEHLARDHPLRIATFHEDSEDRGPSSNASRDDLSWGDAWRAKSAVCAAWLGDVPALKRQLDNARSQGSGAVSWGGRRQSLQDFLQSAVDELSLLSEAKQNEHDSPACGAAMLCATPNRHGFVRSHAGTEARLWKFSGFGRALWDEELSSYESQTARKDAWLRMLQSGRMLASMPVAECLPGRESQLRVYVHDASSVWAIDPMRTEKPAWRFDLPGAIAARPSVAAEDDPPPMFTGLLAEGRLYVHLDAEQPASASGQTLTTSALVCLDARTGRLIWQNRLETFASAFEDARLDGAPLLHHGKLFTVGRRRKPFGFEASFLLRFDLETGLLEWSTHLGEAATGSYGYHRATLTHAAADGDLVFVQSNLGTIAAVSADTGRTIWLTQYESKYADSPEGFWPARMGRPTRAWQYPAVVVWRDAIACMPLDAEQLVVLKQSDGSDVSRTPLEKIGFPETIVGVREDLLYLVGAQVMCYDLSVASPVWQRPLEAGQVFGRGVLTTEGIFIPTDRGLLRYPLEGGPAILRGWTMEDAGNVVALPDQFVVASATGVYGMAGKDDAFSMMTRRMQESGNDPTVALSLAELAFNTGEDERGFGAVDAAIESLGGFARIPDDQTRRRLFTSLTQFANRVLDNVSKAAKDSESNDGVAHRTESAIKLLKMAGQCAPDAAGQVSYRLQLARAQLADGQVAAAVATYQQVLGDRGLREVKLRFTSELQPGLHTTSDAGDDESLVDAGAIVSQWIGRLIAEHGRSVYEAIEGVAEDRLRVAQAAQDTPGLLAVVESYPNSRSAFTALVAHARLTCARLDHTAAFRSFRRAIAQADSRERPGLLQEFIACLAKAGKLELAAEWLSRGARQYPGFRFSLDGRPLSFERYKQELIGDRRFHDPACPVGAWPVDEAFKKLYPDRVSILDPTYSRLPATAWDALLTFCSAQLEARHPRTGSTLWSRPVVCANQPQLLGMDDARFIFATGHRIFALTRTSGQPAWSVGAEPGDDPTEDPESVSAWICHYLTGSRVYSASDRGELVALDLVDGNVRWKQQAQTHVNSQLTADDRHVCFATWQGRQHIIHILDAADGQTVATVRPDDDWPVQSLLMAPNGALLAIFSSAVYAFDPATGKTRWRVGTADRFVPGALSIDDEGLIASPDGRRLAKYDLETGRVLWTTQPVATGPTDGLWAQASGGALFAASGDFLASFDTADGRLLWNVKCPPGVRAEAPRLLDDSIVMVLAQKPLNGAEKKDASRGEPAKVYRIVRFRLKDGETEPITEQGTLTTEPLSSFGGLYVRDGSLILLDGNRLFAFARPKE